MERQPFYMELGIKAKMAALVRHMGTTVLQEPASPVMAATHYYPEEAKHQSAPAKPKEGNI